MPARRSTYVTRNEFRTFAKSVGTRFDRTDDAIRAMGVVLERVDSKVTALAEGLSTLGGNVATDIGTLEKRLTERLERLEAVVRQNSADIARLCEEVAELRGRFDRRDGTLEDHEARIAILEKRAGIRN